VTQPYEKLFLSVCAFCTGVLLTPRNTIRHTKAFRDYFTSCFVPVSSLSEKLAGLCLIIHILDQEDNRVTPRLWRTTEYSTVGEGSCLTKREAKVALWFTDMRAVNVRTRAFVITSHRPQACWKYQGGEDTKLTINFRILAPSMNPQFYTHPSEFCNYRWLSH
jgi:hypothetical protein